ncbi:MAG: thymidine phosphorylase [Burkholderiales bacterium]|nr:thymidine phosphorylase [Burkholderiales bacterium]
MFLPQEIIRKKRDGNVLEAADINAFVRGVAADEVSEGQIAAFTMATYLNGMTSEEAVALTRAMRDSGTVLNWKAFNLPGPIVDKHSSGGVGDVVSLMMGPMVAACGGFVPMISGRGLGHTGGTLDKFDSIPGYQTSISIEKFQQVVRDVGVAIIGQTAELAPADKRIYATRDVTATVESIPLITASILSKKLSAGLDALVMDVKVGSGAFMPTLEKSRELARSIVEVGNGAGVKTSALLTDMNEPLAPCAGNAIEVRCAVDYLIGKSRPQRLHEVTMALSAQLLVTAGIAKGVGEARQVLTHCLESGRAAECFAKMVTALGGPADLLENPRKYMPVAPVIKPVLAMRSGFIAACDTRRVGMVVVALGGGRMRAADKIDFAVGLADIVSLGMHVNTGDLLAMVHARTEEAASSAMREFEQAITISDLAPARLPLVQMLTE